MRLLVFSLLMLCACGEDSPVAGADTSPEDTSAPDLRDTGAEPNEVAEVAEVEEVEEDVRPEADELSDSLDDSGPQDTGDSVEPRDEQEQDTEDGEDTVDGEVTVDRPDIADIADTGPADTAAPTTCPSSVVVATHPVVPSPYVPVCSEVDYPTDPPTSGPHYPVWATYKTYLVPVNPGFLVHSLKHGAIVITWRCPNGCADELTALRELLNRRPADPRCDSLLHHRMVVAPRPDQDKMLVASAWGASFKADCFDLPALTAFIDAHYGQGLEDDCFDGVDIEKIRPDNPWYCPP